MEEKQMRKYPFFRKLGAFSVNLENPRTTIQSLRYAVNSLKQDYSLYIYPEGKITHASDKKPDFKAGLAWLYVNSTEVDFVPVVLYMHTLRGSNPELHVTIGKPVTHSKKVAKQELTRLFEEDIHSLITTTKEEITNL